MLNWLDLKELPSPPRFDILGMDMSGRAPLSDCSMMFPYPLSKSSFLIFVSVKRLLKRSRVKEVWESGFGFGFGFGFFLCCVFLYLLNSFFRTLFILSLSLTFRSLNISL